MPRWGLGLDNQVAFSGFDVSSQRSDFIFIHVACCLILCNNTTGHKFDSAASAALHKQAIVKAKLAARQQQRAAEKAAAEQVLEAKRAVQARRRGAGGDAEMKDGDDVGAVVLAVWETPDDASQKRPPIALVRTQPKSVGFKKDLWATPVSA